MNGSFRKPWLWVGSAVVLAVLALIALGYWYFVKREIPVRYTSAVDQYKYGSIGAETTSMPFFVWEALPDVCPNLLPGPGYASLGFVYEPGHDRPIGFSSRTIGSLDWVGINCATCHVDTFRRTPQASPELIVGMPAQRLDFQRYIRFLLACGNDAQFNVESVMSAINKRHSLSVTDSLLFRHIVIPEIKSRVAVRKADLQWMDSRPEYGPGRFDTFNFLKSQFGYDMTGDSAIGVTDVPPLWNQAARANHQAQWDGMNPLLAERNRGAALGAGATPESVDIPGLEAVEAFSRELQPPAYLYPIDKDLAAQGEPLFQTYCANCHAEKSQSRVGQVIPIDEIDTDRHRMDTITPRLIETLNGVGTGYPWHTTRWRKTNGYNSMLLDGVWARAPYLHNGSVPNMRELLEPVENRTPVFYRGYDVYDPTNLGFISSGPEAERLGFKFDTRLPGNANGGHLYGDTLSAEDKAALLEYLKTR